MGGGIAMNSANVGLPVVLVETTRDALETSVRKGKLSAGQLAQRLALLSGSLQYRGLASCDLVIEAVFENLSLKQDVAARLGAICIGQAHRQDSCGQWCLLRFYRQPHD